MTQLWKKAGEHTILFDCLDGDSVEYLDQMFGDRPEPEETERHSYYRISIRKGRMRNEGVDTIVSRGEKGDWLFDRPDYMLRISADYREADIQFYNYIALRCAMINWYSAIAARLNWGLVVHASCLIQNGEAHLFAGVSGTGKTTVACLSYPRKLLSDEAAIVKLSDDSRVIVYDSPMRSDLFTPAPLPSVPLKAIYLLKQSADIRTRRMTRSEAMLALFDKIWYWPHNRADAAKVVRLCKQLAERVPVYELEFQKNDLFWREIS